MQRRRGTGRRPSDLRREFAPPCTALQLRGKPERQQRECNCGRQKQRHRGEAIEHQGGSSRPTFDQDRSPRRKFRPRYHASGVIWVALVCMVLCKA